MHNFLQRLRTVLFLACTVLYASAGSAEVDTGSGASSSAECVVLLHGLARTAGSMKTLESYLAEAQYSVVNINYPSRDMEIAELSELAVAAGIEQCEQMNPPRIHFVTHSLGGILVRQYFSVRPEQTAHRVVMLGPPNQGSEAVDQLKNMPGYALINGPAGAQLGTNTDSVPVALGAPHFELGIIAGTRSFNPILSTLIPGKDDGKVSVERSKLDGMCGFLALPVTHTFMMSNDDVLAQALYFLKNGQFQHEDAIHYDCGVSTKE